MRPLKEWTYVVELLLGFHEASFLGYWTTPGGRTHNKCYLTPNSKTNEGQYLIKHFAELWKIASNLVRQYFPELASVMAEIPQTERMFDLFSLFIGNITCGTKIHTDSKDYHNGFCAAFPFGNYTGGELYFPVIEMTFLVKPGDLILFKSSALKHGTKEYQGDRKSVVLTIHNKHMLQAIGNKS